MDFNAEEYITNGLLKAFRPKPKSKPVEFTGIDGREFSHRHHNTMTIGNQLRTAISTKDDVDNYVQLKEMARRPHIKSKRNR